MAKKHESVRQSFVTQPVRVSFPHLFKPRLSTFDGKEKSRFEAVLLVPPSTGDIAKLKKLQAALVKEAYGDDEVPLSAAEKAKLPIKPCSESKWFAKDFADWAFLNTWSNQKPAILDMNGDEIFDASMVYAGCWCRFQLGFYTWVDPRGGRLVIAGLEGVQFVKDGERLGGGGSSPSSARDAFGKVAIQMPDEIAAGTEDYDDIL